MSEISKKNPRRQRYLKLTALALALATPMFGHADDTADQTFKFDGSLSEGLSVNAKQWADVPDYKTTGKISMLRTTLKLNGEWDVSPDLAFVGKVRGNYEYETDFLYHLQQMGANNYGSGATGNIMSLYNGGDIRELYADWKASDRVKFRFGRQQIVWGETDFFSANDMVQGFDYTWRSFLEPSNEDLRKPLIMLKANIEVPEANGGFEMFIRPGWDRKKDIGNNLDIYGGRWSLQPYAGVDFRNIDPYNLDNSAGNYKTKTGGIRWNGTTDTVNYSLSYLKTFWQSPMLNPASNDFSYIVGAPPGSFYRPTTVGAANIAPQTGALFGEIIYPIVHVLGATASGYANWADAVFSTEVAYVKDAPYQINNYPNNSVASTIVAPGFDGIKNKGLIDLMVHMDKNIAGVQQLFGAEKPMFFSAQIFDKWIQNYHESDGLLNSVGWGGLAKQHSTLATGIFSLSYDSGRIVPELVLGADLTYKGGFYVPSVAVGLSTNLKWKIEYDGFWDNGNWRNTAPGGACYGQTVDQSHCDSSGLFGGFHNRDQIYTSLTYQF